MKNKFFLIFLLSIVLYSVFYLTNPQETRNVKIENKIYKLLIADSPEEYTKGLMNVRKLNNADGMVFLFEDSQVRNFWNQNTLVDLDIYWMQDDNVVGKSFLPSIETTKVPVTINSEVPVNRVVELIRN